MGQSSETGGTTMVTPTGIKVNRITATIKTSLNFIRQAIGMMSIPTMSAATSQNGEKAEQSTISRSILATAQKGNPIPA